MEYIRQNLELIPVGTASRSRGMLRAEIRDRALKIRISLESMAPAPFGSYSAEMICVKDGSYRRYPLGFIRTDARGRGELLYRKGLEEKAEGPGPEDFQSFRVLRGRNDPAVILEARTEGAVQWQELTQWDGQQKIYNEESQVKPEENQQLPEKEEDTAAKELEIAEEEVQEAYRGEEELKEYLLERMPGIAPFYQSGQKWVRVDPGDLAPLPLNLTEVESDPFIMNGYTRYKHLILSRDRNDYLLGIPYRYLPEMTQEAMKQGCYEFRASHAQAAKKGDFGYWIRKVPIR